MGGSVSASRIVDFEERRGRMEYIALYVVGLWKEQSSPIDLGFLRILTPSPRRVMKCESKASVARSPKSREVRGPELNGEVRGIIRFVFCGPHPPHQSSVFHAADESSPIDTPGSRVQCQSGNSF